MTSAWAHRLVVAALFGLAACANPAATKPQEVSVGQKKTTPRPANTASAGSAAKTPAMAVVIQGPAALSPAAYALAATGLLAPVPGAEISVEDPAGRQLVKGIKTDPTGAAKVPAVVTKATLLFVKATYQGAGGKLSLAAAVPLPASGSTAQVTIDPATTLIAAKVAYLVRTKQVDAAAYGALAPKLKEPLAAKLTAAEVKAAATEGEDVARALDGVIKRDAGVATALTEVGGASAAMVALLKPIPEPTPTPRPSASGSAGPSASPTPEGSPTPTPLPTAIGTVDPSAKPQFTPFPGPIPEPSTTPTPLPTATPTASPTASPSPSPSPTASATASPTT